MSQPVKNYQRGNRFQLQARLNCKLWPVNGKHFPWDGVSIYFTQFHDSFAADSNRCNEIATLLLSCVNIIKPLSLEKNLQTYLQYSTNINNPWLELSSQNCGVLPVGFDPWPRYTFGHRTVSRAAWNSPCGAGRSGYLLVNQTVRWNGKSIGKP